MQIEIPPEAAEVIRSMAADAGFSNVDEFVLNLILTQQSSSQVPSEAASHPYFEKKILEGLDSGEAAPLTTDDFDKIRANVLKHV